MTRKPLPRVARLVVLTLLATTCGGDGQGATGATPSPATHTIKGTFTFVGNYRVFDLDYVNVTDGETCDAGEGGGYEDIREGASVTVKDAKGEIVATSRLSQGMVEVTGEAEFGTKEGNCIFHFTITVPDSAFYQIEVSHRGPVTFSKDDLERNGWEAKLELKYIG